MLCLSHQQAIDGLVVFRIQSGAILIGILRPHAQALPSGAAVQAPSQLAALAGSILYGDIPTSDQLVSRLIRDRQSPFLEAYQDPVLIEVVVAVPVAQVSSDAAHRRGKRRADDLDFADGIAVLYGGTGRSVASRDPAYATGDRLAGYHYHTGVIGALHAAVGPQDSRNTAYVGLHRPLNGALIGTGLKAASGTRNACNTTDTGTARSRTLSISADGSRVFAVLNGCVRRAIGHHVAGGHHASNTAQSSSGIRART